MVTTKIIEPAAGAYHYPLLIKSLLLSGQRYEPNREIVYADKRRYDYRTFNERVCRLAHALGSAGVKAGDTVAVLDWDSHRYLECFFAIPMIGAVLHTVNIRLSPEQIIYTMNHAEDDFVLVHDDFLLLMEQVHPRLETVKHYLQLSDDTPPATELPTVGEYEALLAAAPGHYDFPDFDENSVATTFYTTGTTGNPKGVYFTHRQLVLHTLATATSLSAFDGQPLLRSDDVYMPITPMFHVHAWGVPYVATLLGVKQVYPGRYEPNALVKLYRDEKVTFSHCVPTILQMVINSEAAGSTDLSGWKLVIGGSALPTGLAAAAAERGMDLYSAYGMSETCPILALTYLRDQERGLSPDQQLTERVKTGTAIPMVDLQLTDDAGQPLPHDGETVGELVVRAPWLTQGYFREPEKGAELWRGGWLHTGDVASIDGRSVVEIKDRMKDVIKTGGEWISSLELENLISQHPGVNAVAVVGVPDPQWGERPLALVVPAEGSLLRPADINEHLQRYVDSGALTKWAVPGEISLVDDIPKTSVGKINKKLIREDHHR
ncbi:fatty acid--CoA ligase [Motiliproteus sediminis]|uniref:fatty acid--CoA ligase n=1 Tax=Motiliproteus sediminis TaxID=1468178 RepID=UPI001AEFE76C|nr:fatty acid--CoA ligase [Motiliproteus sediminis]